MKKSAFAVLAIALSAACGDSTVGPGGSGGQGTGGVGGTGANAVEGALTVEWGPSQVPSGTEDTRCVVKRLGNKEKFFAHQIRNELGATSHHFIVYRAWDRASSGSPPCSKT